MGASSRLTPAQQADAVARHRDGRPDKAAMSNEERRAAGLMDRRQAAQHERLTVIPCTRLADRSRGPDPDDIWAAPDPAARRRAWHEATTAADANPDDDFAQYVAGAAANLLAGTLGHGGHGGWLEDWQGLVCKCGTLLEPWEGAA